MADLVSVNASKYSTVYTNPMRTPPPTKDTLLHRVTRAATIMPTPPPTSRPLTTSRLSIRRGLDRVKASTLHKLVVARTLSAPTLLTTPTRWRKTLAPYRSMSAPTLAQPRYRSSHAWRVTENPAFTALEARRPAEPRVSADMIVVQRLITEKTGEHVNLTCKKMRNHLRELADERRKNPGSFDATLETMLDNVMKDHGVPASEQGWKARAKRLLKGATPTAKEIVIALALSPILAAIGV
ncbi:MAG: hypothetical protein SP1CHLAM54_15030 [Chlamydiia bacterium]|nr:hypothetical protein [Chlamydiia bacterium]MCH9616393.1 hypothetical protein [Chlamydiia bacterium]MCH9629621.1 hypothetical protein [Chlamydiia bacterium]